MFAQNQFIHCWLQDVEDPESRVEFGMDKEYSFSYSATINTVDIPGRTQPYHMYSFNSSPETTLPIRLGVGFTHHSADALWADINFLISLCYPDYSGQVVRPPHEVLVFLSGYKNFKGLVKSVQETARAGWNSSGKPLTAEMALSVSIIYEFPPDLNDFRDGRVWENL